MLTYMQMHGVTQEATNKLVYDAGYIKLRSKFNLQL
jgi:hypothetical protein